MIKVLLIGGSATVRSHVFAALDALRPQSSCTVVSSVQVGRDLAAHASPAFDAVVVDLGIDDADPAVLLVDLHSASSVRPIVALPVADRRGDVLAALQLGASGVLPRDATADDTLTALRTVLEGGMYMPARVMRAQEPAQDATVPPRQPVARPWTEPAPTDLARLGLTSRQTEVLAMLLRGQSNKAIARELHLSVETIKDHVAAVLRGLAVQSRTQAVLAVERMLRERNPLRSAPPTLQSAWHGALAAPATVPAAASSPR